MNFHSVHKEAQFAHLDVNLARKSNGIFTFRPYSLDIDLKIKNPGWHPPTRVSVYYELAWMPAMSNIPLPHYVSLSVATDCNR